MEDWILFGTPDDADRWWDVLLTIGAWVLGILSTALLAFIGYFARKADKKLDQLGDVLVQHDKLFAGQIERNQNQDDWRRRIDAENAKQQLHLERHDGDIAEHGQVLAAHGQSIKFLERDKEN